MKKAPPKKKKHAGGRPTKMTPETIGKLREVFLLDYNIQEACDYAGIHVDTYYEEKKRNPKFAEDMEKAQRALFMSAKTIVAGEIIVKKNPKMALDLLKHRQPERYRTKVETDPQPIGNITVILPGNKPHPRILPEE